MGAIRDLQDQIAAMPDAAALRARFASILGDLHDRAQAAYIHELEIAMLRREIVDARIDRALAVLQQRAEAAGWSPAEVRAVAMAWIARADVFVDAPDPEAYRARIMATMEVAMKRAAGVLDDVRELRIELLRLQLQSATSRLDAALASGEISEHEYEELIAANIRRVRAIYMSELAR